MRKLAFILLIGFTTITLNSCASTATATSDKWLEYEFPPSRIVKNGSVFYQGKLSDGSLFSVYYDSAIHNDGDYYNAILRQDFGWRRIDSGSWSGGNSAREKKEGHIYINPSKRVAIYYYPDGKYHGAFKVSIKT